MLSRLNILPVSAMKTIMHLDFVTCPLVPPDINVVRCRFVIIGSVLREKQLLLQVLSKRSSTLTSGGPGGKTNKLKHRFRDDCFYRRHRSGCTYLFVNSIHVHVIPTMCHALLDTIFHFSHLQKHRVGCNATLCMTPGCGDSIIVSSSFNPRTKSVSRFRRSGTGVIPGER